MPATTTLLGLVTPTQGTLSGTWGDTVNYGITDYVDISVAGTLTLTNDGAVTLANTTGSSSGNSITSSLTGAGTVTAQFAIVKVTGTLTTAKVVTGPSYSKTYTVVNSATGSTVTFKASGQTGVSIAVGETAFVYFNGTDYVKVVGTATAGAAGGSTTQVQYNNAGVLAGITGATTNGTALTLVAPVLGTPASATLTNATGLPIATGVSGLGTGVATFLATPSSANLRSALTDETGTGSAVFATSPTLVTPTLGVATATSLQGIIGNVTPAAGTFTTVTGSNDASLNGLTVGRGAGAVSFNSVLGYQAGAGNTTGTQHVLIGYQAGAVTSTATNVTAVGYQAASGATGSGITAIGTSAAQNSTGDDNIAVGAAALLTNSSGANNTAIGRSALRFNTTASNNTAVGYQAGYSNTTAGSNVFFGYKAGYAVVTGDQSTFLGYNAGVATTGTENLFIGASTGLSNTSGSYNTYVGRGNSTAAGYLMTTGSKNTILGGYSGNNGGLDIRTASNYIVLSDGDGNPLISTNSTRSVALNGAVPQTGTGITFPATQSASSDANTLDDYEEGTWTPAGVLGSAGTSSTSNVVATYTKVGRLVNIVCSFNFTLGTGSGNFSVSGLPFTANSALVYTAISTGCENVGASSKTIVGYINPSNTNLFLIFQPQSTGTSVIVTSGEMASTSVIRISATYFTS